MSFGMIMLNQNVKKSQIMLHVYRHLYRLYENFYIDTAKSYSYLADDNDENKKQKSQKCDKTKTYI